MNTCPNGHEVEEGLDYCEECGARVTGAPATAASAAPPAPRSWSCRQCDTTQSNSRFCEACGEPNPDHPDFAGGLESAPQSPTPEPATDPIRPQQDPEPPAVETVDDSGWLLTAAADRDYFSRIQGFNGPDAGGIQFPVVYPPRRFVLNGQQVFIGRRSRSRGIEPDIDLSGAPMDPGVSHSHAAIVATENGGWALVDVGSANGTYLNGAADPIEPGQPQPLTDGDQIQLGAWTRLTISRQESG